MKSIYIIIIAVILLFLFNRKDNVDFKKKISEGAIVIDVRTTEEYSRGHIENSVNIPLDILEKSLDLLNDKEKTIITCCASGMRSEKAKKILKKLINEKYIHFDICFICQKLILTVYICSRRQF